MCSELPIKTLAVSLGVEDMEFPGVLGERACGNSMGHLKRSEFPGTFKEKLWGISMGLGF